MSYLVIKGECNTLINCCGVKELGGLWVEKYSSKENLPKKKESYTLGVINLADTTGSDFHQMIRNISANHRSAFIQVWFADGGGDGIYGAEEFRDLLIKYGAGPDRELISLGSAVNPNSGNTIDGYMWKTNQ